MEITITTSLEFLMRVFQATGAPEIAAKIISGSFVEPEVVKSVYKCTCLNKGTALERCTVTKINVFNVGEEITYEKEQSRWETEDGKDYDWSPSEKYCVMGESRSTKTQETCSLEEWENLIVKTSNHKLSLKMEGRATGFFHNESAEH